MRRSWPTFACARCGATNTASIVSKYNLDEICIECKHDERRLPSYAHADAEEVASVRAGHLNFPGVGLTDEDHAALEKMRAERAS